MDNRGIFLTKCKKQTRIQTNMKLGRLRDAIENTISKFQDVGNRGRSTTDKPMLLNTTIDYKNL